MDKEPKQPAEYLQDTVELDVEAIFRACDEAASQEAAQTERPVNDQVTGSEEVVVQLNKWS